MAKRSAGKRMRMIRRTAGHQVKQLEVKPWTTSGRSRSRLVEVVIAQPDATSAVHSPRSSLSKHSRSPSKQHMHTDEDALDMEYDDNAPPVEPLQLPRKKTQNDYIREWLPHKEEFMRVLLELEAPPDPQNCISCGTDGLVQHWIGEFFEELALHMTGAQLQLGHIGAACLSDPSNANGTGGPVKMNAPEWEDVDDVPPHMRQPIRSKYLTVIDVTGVHFIPVRWCQCEAAESFRLQLLRAKLFPATFEKPSTAFTFAVLDDFVTSGVFPHLVPAPKKGELGLFCAACPQPGINVDPAEDLDQCPADQVWLMDGHGFIVTDPDYRTYLKATPHIMEKSACNNHKAINQANAQWGRLHSTGIGAGWVDGEIIKTLWSLLNIASTLAQGMSSPHRQELLDFQISDCNFMKMIHMVDSLIWKLTTARVAADMAKWAFKTLDEAVSMMQHDTWTYQEQVAFRD
ncbi:hypothetical protein BKA82DRAFT_4016401 [Pisolithus tinctorius]|nr:hypothetical protein BKA82DRAFT_4016401 [Pisolithus tinctorius]